MPMEKLPYEQRLLSIAQLDHRPSLHVTKNIGTVQPKLSTILRSNDQSSLGLLECFPNEILLLIFDMLDFQSLCRISRVSARGHSLVQSLSAFTDIVQRTPETLTSLARSNLLKYHSAALLCETLRSGNCVSCSRFGVYLVHATCERACYECTAKNIALHMITADEAQECFKLKVSDLKKIPIARVRSGHLQVSLRPKPPRFQDFGSLVSLVNVKQAKQLAINIYGSIRDLPKDIPEDDEPISKWRRLNAQRPSETPEGYKRFLDAPLGPLEPNDFEQLGNWLGPLEPKDLEPLSDWSGSNKYFNVAYNRFPYLNEEGLDYGRQCAGCTWMSFFHFRLPASVLTELFGSNLSRDDTVLRLKNNAQRIFNKPEFDEHAEQCYGVNFLLDEYDNWFENYTQGKPTKASNDRVYLAMHRRYDEETPQRDSLATYNRYCSRPCAHTLLRARRVPLRDHPTTHTTY